MDYYKFFNFLQTYSRISHAPKFLLWPGEITLNSQTWDYIRRIYGFTFHDGYEYAQTLYFADSDIVATKIQRGYRDYVYINQRVELKYKPVPGKDEYEKQILIDSSIVMKYKISSAKIPRQHEVGTLFSIHTHPIQEYGNRKFYSFFSDRDINSLLSGNYLCVGLVTDKLWLACKSDMSGRSLDSIQTEKLLNITRLIYEGGDFVPYISNSLNIGVVFYVGEFGKKLERVN